MKKGFDPQLSSTSPFGRNSLEARLIQNERWCDYGSVKRGYPRLKRRDFPHGRRRNCEEREEE